MTIMMIIKEIEEIEEIMMIIDKLSDVQVLYLALSLTFVSMAYIALLAETIFHLTKRKTSAIPEHHMNIHISMLLTNTTVATYILMVEATKYLETLVTIISDKSMSMSLTILSISAVLMLNHLRKERLGISDD